MRIAVLTNRGSLFGKKVLNALASENVPVDAVVAVSQPPIYYWRLFGYVRKRVGIADAAYFAIERLLEGIAKKEPDSWNGRPFKREYAALGRRVVFTKGTNSAGTEQALRKIAPDLLILGQTGIVKKNILSVPRIGAINAHPGMLPHYRGIDCAKWAIYNDDPGRIGVTVHWVDEGVDTGRIISKHGYELREKETIGTLEEALNDLCAVTAAKAAAGMAKGTIPKGTGQKQGEGRQYFKMPRKLEMEVGKKLAQA